MTIVPAPVSHHLFDDQHFIVDHVDSCEVPGYVVIRLKADAESLADLGDEQASRLGAMLAKVTRAVEVVTKADRVYCLSFCEVDRRLHFHVFPRTSTLLDIYRRASGTASKPVNGPMLFEWARTCPPEALKSLGGSARVLEVCDALRARLS